MMTRTEWNRVRPTLTKAEPPCLVCGTEQLMHLFSKWQLDHCHEHGTVRGTLCTSCNSLMVFIDTGHVSTGCAYLLPELLAHRDRCPQCRLYSWPGMEPIDIPPDKPAVTAAQ